MEPTKVALALNHLLSDVYILLVKTKNFHWNVTGPLFPQLHQLFDDQYSELAEAVDTIAERVRALQSFVPGSLAEFQKMGSLKETIGTKPLSAEDMIKTLLQDHEAIIAQLYKIFSIAEKSNDQGTIDLMTERMRAHEKTAWMLRSSLK